MAIYHLDNYQCVVKWHCVKKTDQQANERHLNKQTKGKKDKFSYENNLGYH